MADALSLQIMLSGADVPAQQARRITLTGSGSDSNDLNHPDRVMPAEDRFAVPGAAVNLELKPNSLTILRVKAKIN